MNESVLNNQPNEDPSAMVRRFRPRWWAALLAFAFAAITIYLGNWQGGKADWKVAQQQQLDAARAAPPIDVFAGPNTAENVTELRYRAITANGRFEANQMFFVDNRIQDGKAGYVIAQLFVSERDGIKKNVIVDRGWIQAPPNHATLPAVATPNDTVQIVGRINAPQSRNPGTMDNDVQNKRVNYLNLAELGARLGVTLEPYVFEQTAGPGFLGTQRAAPSLNFEKNRAYQVQWYAFAALAVVSFVVLSFRKVSVS
jgi:surfeit locus 1 family protein